MKYLIDVAWVYMIGLVLSYAFFSFSRYLAFHLTKEQEDEVKQNVFEKTGVRINDVPSHPLISSSWPYLYISLIWPYSIYVFIKRLKQLKKV